MKYIKMLVGLVFLAVTDTALAQSVTPLFALDKTGASRKTQVFDPSNSAWVSTGLLDTTSHVWWPYLGSRGVTGLTGSGGTVVMSQSPTLTGPVTFSVPDGASAAYFYGVTNVGRMTLTGSDVRFGSLNAAQSLYVPLKIDGAPLILNSIANAPVTIMGGLTTSSADGTNVALFSGTTNVLRVTPTSTDVRVGNLNTAQTAYAPLRIDGAPLSLNSITNAPLAIGTGGIAIPSGSPAVTTDALYNVNHTLYFNGSPIGNNASLVTAPATQGLSPGVCTGSADATTLNSLLSSQHALTFSPAATCNVAAPLVLGSSGPFVGQIIKGSDFSAVLQPSAAVSALFDIGGATNQFIDLGNMQLVNQSSYAASGVRYHNSVGNNRVNVHDMQMFSLTNGVLEDASYPGGDALSVFNSWFLNNTNAINFANNGMNSSIRSNYVLGGNGFLFGKAAGGQQNEGTRVYDNTVLPAIDGASSVKVTAGLELQFLANILDQNKAHAVILDATVNPVSAIKFVSDWLGTAAGIAANQNGIDMRGGVEYVPVIATTAVGFASGINTGSGGVQNLGIGFSKFYGNTTRDVTMSNVAGATLVGNVFASSTGSWSENAMSTGITAIGNRCTVAATGISPADLILGDGSCGPNQIPGPLTINGQMTISAASSSANAPAQPIDFKWLDGSSGSHTQRLQAVASGFTFNRVSGDPANGIALIATSSGTPIVSVTSNYGATNVDLRLSALGSGSLRLGSAAVAEGSLTVNGPFYFASYAPASSSQSCTAGAATYDATYYYVCAATNTWKRIAFSTF